jgi:hypothetical protein
MNYIATSINESPVISVKAGAAIDDVRGKAVKFDANGAAVLCAAGDAALGIGIMNNNDPIVVGGDVDIQIKDMGLVVAGAAAIKAGDELASDANGKLIKATDGQNVVAIALEASSAADTYIKALLVRYAKAAAAGVGG